MTRTLSVRNRQRRHPVNTALVRRLAQFVLVECCEAKSFMLCFHFVADPEMTRLNEHFLRHAGSTDVITFDYADPNEPACLAGEIFICLDEACRQARRFHTTWQAEVARYLIHGLLHLKGYDDVRASLRRGMKRLEDRWMKAASARFELRQLARTQPARSRKRVAP